MNTLQLLGAIEIGLIYSLVALGVMLSFRIIDFPDLTVDGSLTLGAGVAATLITAGINPLLATVFAMLIGALAGMLTGYLSIKWHILGLLAGILTMTALYSINLRIMGKPNIAIMDQSTIFSHYPIIFVLLAMVIFTLILLTWFFSTQFGLAVRGAGINPLVSYAQGISVGKMKIVVLALSNALVALSGALFAQSQGFADISMGQGTIIIGLASIIIGETLFPQRKMLLILLACIFGSLLYRIAVAFALNLHCIGLQAQDLNLITALLVVLTMILPKMKKALASRTILEEPKC